MAHGRCGPRLRWLHNLATVPPKAVECFGQAMACFSERYRRKQMFDIGIGRVAGKACDTCFGFVCLVERSQFFMKWASLRLVMVTPQSEIIWPESWIMP